MTLRAYFQTDPCVEQIVKPIAATVLFLLIAYTLEFLTALPKKLKPKTTVPISVNYHFTRQCNKSCGFSFHTATSPFKLSERQAWKGLKKLKDAGMKKINFAGGETFLYPKFLASMLVMCKKDLQLDSVSIVTNGSLVKKEFLEENGRYIDILAVSCDSFDEETIIAIGRGSGDQVTKLFQIAEWCKEFGTKFKLNTVVCNLNYQEDMNETIEQLQPFRWKCFQVLVIPGENDSDDTLHDARNFEITDEQYEEFRRRHQHQPSFVAEPNNIMVSSYLILDEKMRFLDKDGRSASSSVLDVDVSTALAQVYWDEESFVKRGGVYEWSRRGDAGACSTADDKKLEW